MPKPKIFLSRALPQKVMERLYALFDVEMNEEDRALEKQELAAGIQGKDALLCMLTDSIDADLMDANPKLKMIANYAVGFDNIDLAAANDRGIKVSNTPGVLTDASADMAFSLMLSLARRIPEADKFLRTGAWKGWGPQQFLGIDIFEATLGIIGLGRIGRAVAKRARGFDMTIMYWNRTRLDEQEEKALGLTYRNIETLLDQADFVSLHAAYTAATRHLIGQRELKLMKPSAFLINTARGPIVDEQALVEALHSKEIAGAGLDVYEEEPRVHPELIGMANTVLLPHIASATIAARSSMGMIAIDNLEAFFAGKPLPNPVH